MSVSVSQLLGGCGSGGAAGHQWQGLSFSYPQSMLMQDTEPQAAPGGRGQHVEWYLSCNN